MARDVRSRLLVATRPLELERTVVCPSSIAPAYARELLRGGEGADGAAELRIRLRDLGVPVFGETAVESRLVYGIVETAESSAGESLALHVTPRLCALPDVHAVLRFRRTDASRTRLALTVRYDRLPGPLGALCTRVVGRRFAAEVGRRLLADLGVRLEARERTFRVRAAGPFASA